MSKQRPTGTVTFLFTDIEGSTQHWEQHPAWMEQAFARQEAILRTVMARCGGYVYKMVGDAFQVAFSTAASALKAVVDAQRALQAEHWGDHGPLLVRMALHTAVVEERADDYVGPQLNRVARLLDAGHGGQALLTRAVYDLVIDELPVGVTLNNLGEHRLKDLVRPEEVFQLTLPDLLHEFPPLKTLSNLPNNLPVPVTSFVGREREINEVKRLLSTNRLVTLTGPGGTGKTRLALQVAGELLDTYPHGIWFVELASLVDPALIPATTVAALRIDPGPARVNSSTGLPSRQTLFEYLRSKQALVIFDNCEHLVESSASLIDELLQACPGLRVMATSREILGAMGEVNFRCPSLSMPDMRKLPQTIEQCTSEAMQLFFERAANADPNFSVTAQSLRLIAQVCQRLDGIPLAIELAAARLRMLSLEGIASRLDDTFRLLTGGSRTALPRQQTLRASIDWSYTLLSLKERTLFMRLSVFAGGFSLDAAENVCADPWIGKGDLYDHAEGSEEQAVLEQEEIFDLLTQLVDKSLVQVIADEKVEHRYRQLQTIRSYARDRLLDSGSVRFVRDRHLAYFMLLAEEAEAYLRGKDQVRWLDLLEAELDNLRNAMEWSLSGKAIAGLRLALAMRWFWHIRSYALEGVGWIERLLAADQAAISAIVDDQERARVENDPNRLHTLATAMSTAGILMDLHSDIERGLPMLEMSAEICRRLGRPGSAGLAINLIYMSNSRLSWEQRHDYLVQAEEILRAQNDRFHLAEALMFQAHLALDKNETETARPYLEESLQLRQELEDLDGIGITYTDLGILEFRLGRYDQAIQCYEKAKSYFEQVKNKRLLSYMESSLGIIALIEGDYQAAFDRFETVVRLGKESGNQYAIGEGLYDQASLAWETGDFLQAEKKYREVLDWSYNMNSMRFVASALLNLSTAILSRGDVRQAQSTLAESIQVYTKWSEGEFDHNYVLGMAINLGLVQLELGNTRDAARLLSMASSSPVWNVRLMTPRQRKIYENALARLRAALGEQAFEAAWLEGQLLTPQEAVALATVGSRAVFNVE
ncbi:MAG TPA: tetratricopeptide repeat protein [Levilinea sp.]|nr:tetratricopeptide repeat protein [Levilinea sp.]